MMSYSKSYLEVKMLTKTNKTTKRSFISMGIMIFMAVLLAACQSAAASTEELTKPLNPPVPKDSRFMPMVKVDDQSIETGTVTVDEVVSAGPGWLVIHAQADGKPGPVLGYAPVADGVNDDVRVEIDADNATETLYAMLHTDAGTQGEYEFPGDDVPVKVAEQLVTPAFKVIDDMAVVPSVSVEDQEIVDGTVTVGEVVSAGPGWLVIHAQADGKPGPVLGYAPVADGVNDDVRVEIDADNATETLYAMLHTDAGIQGEYEFPGDDVPMKVAEQIVTPAFNVIDDMAVVPSVSVADQGIVDGTVTVDEIISEGPGWLVIHAQAEGKPGPVLGYAPVADGVNDDVQVEIDVDNATETLYAMLHTDAGTVGEYEFPGDDVPVKVAEQVVTPAFKLMSSSVSESSQGDVMIKIFDSYFLEDNVTIPVGTTVMWIMEGAFPHTVTAENGSFDSGPISESGAIYKYTFTEAGTYNYYCQYHGGPGGQGMSATIVVTE